MNMTNIAELYHSGNCIHFSYRGRKSNKTPVSYTHLTLPTIRA